MLTMTLYEHGVFFGKPSLGGNHRKFYICLQSMVGTTAITLHTRQLFVFEKLKAIVFFYLDSYLDSQLFAGEFKHFCNKGRGKMKKRQ